MNSPFYPKTIAVSLLCFSMLSMIVAFQVRAKYPRSPETSYVKSFEALSRDATKATNSSVGINSPIPEPTISLTRDGILWETTDYLGLSVAYPVGWSTTTIETTGRVIYLVISPNRYALGDLERTQQPTITFIGNLIEVCSEGGDVCKIDNQTNNELRKRFEKGHAYYANSELYLSRGTRYIEGVHAFAQVYETISGPIESDFTRHYVLISHNNILTISFNRVTELGDKLIDEMLDNLRYSDGYSS